MTKFNFLNRRTAPAETAAAGRRGSIGRNNSRAKRTAVAAINQYDIIQELRDPQPFLSAKKGRQHG